MTAWSNGWEPYMLIDPEKAAMIMAGEQSSGTFIPVPGESPRIRERHAARVLNVQSLGSRPPSLPSRSTPEWVNGPPSPAATSRRLRRT